MRICHCADTVRTLHVVTRDSYSETDIVPAVFLLLLLHLIPTHFYVGSMHDETRLHVARSYTSSADSPFFLMSSFTLSNHLLLGLPLFLLPCTFITIALLPTQCSSLRITCPYHFNLLSCTLFVTSPTFVVILILTFLIFNAHVSAPVHQCWSYHCSVHLPLDLHIHSHVAQHSRHSLQVLPPALHSVGDFRIQFSANVDPRYVNVFTLFTKLATLVMN